MSEVRIVPLKEVIEKGLNTRITISELEKEYICILNTAAENFIRKVKAQNEQEAKDKFIEYLNEEIDEYYFGHEDKDYVICKDLNDIEEV